MPEELSLTVPPELYEAIKTEAERQGQTLAALTRSILWDWFTRKGGLIGTRTEDRVPEQS
jgi:hypothetical protein